MNFVEIIPWTAPQPIPSKPKPKAKPEEKSLKESKELLEKFVGMKAVGTAKVQGGDVVMNEDGTMVGGDVDEGDIADDEVDEGA